MRCYIFALAGLLWGSSAIVTAAVPRLLNYQGQLTLSNNQPADGTYSLVFTIYDAASGGTAIWTESQTTVTVSKGTFSVLLGLVNPMSDSAFSDTVRYLGVKIGADPEMVPRTRLVSSGYAIRVGTLDGATGGTLIGNVNFQASTSTAGNILKEGVPFLHNFGNGNTFAGLYAGNFSMTGEYNSSFGVRALEDNTTGYGNTATGLSALRYNTTGSSNTANGIWALAQNMTGYSNTATGANALRTNSDGYNNTASGYYALGENTSGGNNTACGAHSLSTNSLGMNNTATGFSALSYNTTGSENTASGAEALRFNNGDHNTASGAWALHYNFTGFENTACGANAMKFNTSGDGNTAHGFNALCNNHGNGNTADGAHALVTNDNGYANTAVGHSALYSNTTGFENTASGQGALRSNTTGYDNIATGFNALYNNTIGTSNTACGILALGKNVTGTNNTAIGFGADVASESLINATAIGNGALVDASNKIRLGDVNVTVIEGQVAYTYTSDKKQKENFRPVNSNEVLAKIKTMHLTSWNYKNQDPTQFRHYGPIAQEFFAAFGHDGFGTCGDSTTINSGDMAGITLIAVKALAKENEDLRAELRDLNALVQRLIARETRKE